MFGSWGFVAAVVLLSLVSLFALVSLSALVSTYIQAPSLRLCFCRLSWHSIFATVFRRAFDTIFRFQALSCFYRHSGSSGSLSIEVLASVSSVRFSGTHYVSFSLVPQALTPSLRSYICACVYGTLYIATLFVRAYVRAYVRASVLVNH